MSIVKIICLRDCFKLLKSFIFCTSPTLALGAKFIHYLTCPLPWQFNLGLKPIQQRKLLRAVAKNLLPPDAPHRAQVHVQPVVSDSGTSQAVPVPMDIEPNLTCSSSVDPPVHSTEVPNIPQSDTLSVRYIHCQNLFTLQAEEKALHNISPTTSLEELIKLIASAEGIADDMTLELYFSEGYPLDANRITLKGDNYCSIIMLLNCI